MAAMDIYALYREIEARLTAPGAAFEVELAEHVGRNVRAWRHRAANIVPMMQLSEQRFADRVLVWEDSRTFSYATIFSRARRLAHILVQQHGVGKGTRIGIAMRNRKEWFEGFVASQWLGATLVLFNSRSAADELANATKDVECAVIIADQKCADRLGEARVAAPVLTIDALTALIDAETTEAPMAEPDPDAAALILFTSGTTGRPKGATLTQFNLVNAARNLEFVQNMGLEIAAGMSGMSMTQIAAARPVPSSLMIAPLFHLSGVTSFLSTMLSGGRLSIMPRWDPALAVELIAEHRVTAFTGPPLVLADIVDHVGAAEKLATLGSFSIAGQATPLALLEKVRAVLPRVSAGTGWGGTETGGSVAVASGPIYMLEPGSAGVTLPISEVSVRDDDGRILPAGETGELWVHGGLVMQGYWGNDAATSAAITDGWFRTGDIGIIDARGFIFISDRLKDMVISAGENIYCAEIERVIGGIAGVTEVAVFGVADERLGERVVAAVNIAEGSGLSEAKLADTARAALADYKVPKSFVLDLGPMPRNAVGKIDKRQLRALYLDRSGAA